MSENVILASEAHPKSDSGQDGYQTVTRQARMTAGNLSISLKIKRETYE